MPKNIVVCCDGTANEFARDRTNVVRLYGALVHDPARQVAYYHPGLGTMEAVGAITGVGRKLTILLGLAVGYGLGSDVRDAYVFLMQHFEPGDRVYLFGFSRGAYTVRAVASLLHMYGLIRPGNEPLVPYAIRMLSALSRRRGRGAGAASEVNEVFELAGEFKSTFSSVECKPHFVGVWDTVSSVGWIENPLRLPYTANNPDIRIGRHAVAIDERRAFFRMNLWRPSGAPGLSGPEDLQQVWFPGVHADVGGGYKEAESGLAKIALRWMLREAMAAGLLVDAARMDVVLGAAPSPDGTRNSAPDANAKLHESLTPAWWWAEFVPKRSYSWKSKRLVRRMNLFHRRRIPAGALVHESAYERGDDYARRLPGDAVRVS